MAARKDSRPFWGWVDQSGGLDSCWEWTGARNRRGYGIVNRRTYGQSLAHRVVYEMAHGSIPEGAFVMHGCDNPPCCNPLHLSAGSHVQNMEDAKKRGRTSSGEAHVWSKLTGKQVNEIRDRAAAGEMQRVIAADFGIRRQTVSDIVNKRTWRNAA